jgi:tRNA nucleotidyltransferase (CCA-adding enzyme)
MTSQAMTTVLDPMTPIHQALEAMGEASLAKLVFPEAPGTQAPLWVRRSDLWRMRDMGLSMVPVEAVGVPDLNEFTDIAHATPLRVERQQQLSHYFPRAFVAALYELQPLFREMSLEGYVVGGLIRDMFLRPDPFRAVPDVDIVVIGDAIATCQALADRSPNLTLEETFPQFGTAKLRYRGEIEMDVASSRHEVYPTCGALPVVDAMGVPLALDVQRRDFTINALVLAIHDLGTVLDHTQGLEDIAQFQLRALHPATFFEDPSRLLRAMKFAARYDMGLTPDTEQLIQSFMRYGAAYYKGGGDRIKAELKAFVCAEESDCKRYWLQQFAQMGWIRVVQMTGADWPFEALGQRWCQLSLQLDQWRGAVAKVTPMSMDLVWQLFLVPVFSVLPEAQREPAMDRLGLDRHRREAVHQAIALERGLVLTGIALDSPPSAIYDVMHCKPLASLIWASLMAAPATEVEGAHNLLDTTAVLLQALTRYQTRWRLVKPELNGDDLIALGVPEGEAVGQTLRRLTRARLDGQIRTREDEIAYIKR